MLNEQGVAMVTSKESIWGRGMTLQRKGEASASEGLCGEVLYIPQGTGQFSFISTSIFI